MCLSAAAPSTSPPPYGPASPSTDELHLDADSPTNKFPTTKEGSATFNASSSSAPSTAPFSSSSSSSSTGTIPPSLEPLQYHSAAAAAAAQAAAAYTAYTAAHGGGSFSSAYGAGSVSAQQPACRGITPAGDCARRPRPPRPRPHPTRRASSRAAASRLRHADHHVAGRAAAMPAAGDRRRSFYPASAFTPALSFEAGSGGGYHQPAYQHKRHRAGRPPVLRLRRLPRPRTTVSAQTCPGRGHSLAAAVSYDGVKPAGSRAAGSRTNTRAVDSGRGCVPARPRRARRAGLGPRRVADAARAQQQAVRGAGATARPACNKGPWTEEDALILERVQQHGTK